MLTVTQLSGFGAGASAAVGLTSIAFFNSATSVNTASVTCPSGVIAGDLIVYANRGREDESAVVPSGYTQILEMNFGDGHTIVSAKLASGSEGGNSITGMGGISQLNAVAVFRPNIPATAFSASTPNKQSTSGNPSPQTVLSAAGTPPLIVFGVYSGHDSVSPRSMTPAKDGEISPFNEFWLAWKIYNSNPANVVVDMNDETQSSLASFFVSVA